MESKSKENKTSSIKEEKIEYTGEISADILEDIKKVSKGKSGLVVIKGPGIGDKFFINKPEFTIGRNTESDIFLDDITVSRRHAIIIKSGNNFRLKDLGSLNGSYVNSELAEDVILEDMDKIQIGKYIFLFFHSSQSSNG